MKEHLNLKKPPTIRQIIIVLAFFGICLLAATCQPDPATHPESGPWYSILPPLIAVTLAVLTNRLFFSLAAAVVIGGFLTAVPEAPLSLQSWGKGLYTVGQYAVSAVWDPDVFPSDAILITAFVVFVMAMISVITVAGGLHAIAAWLGRFAKGPRSTELVTALVGVAVFIDDYANTMIVGSTMRPLSDRNRVSREKLAFLVDATSAPVAGIAVISTWIGYEVGWFDKIAEKLEIARDGYSMFFDALPFRFYCFMMLIFVFINVLSGADYGSMRRAERRTRKTGAPAEPDARPMTSRTFTALAPDSAAHVRVLTAVLPLAVLFIFFLASLWVDGGGMETLRSHPIALLSLRSWRDVMSQAAHNIPLLAVAAALGLLVAVACALVLARLSVSAAGKALASGFRSSLLPILILVLAWSLKEACDGLDTDQFLVATLSDVLSPVWFPALLFLVASLTAFATGTSWGTMAILLPTAIPIAFHLDGDAYGLTTVICLGAVLDGAILGDHCSPISDTTIMSSIFSSCDHVHHVRTQIPYSLTVGALAILCGYLPAALGVSSWIGIAAATGAMTVLFLALTRRR